MKVVFIEWDSFGKEDMLSTYRSLGHTVISIPFQNVDYRKDSSFESLLSSRLKITAPDYVFSFNYIPVVSLVCHQAGVPYVSWVYDSPHVLLYSYTAIYPTNHIYVFDKELCLEFNRSGIRTVHYLPMAANTDRLDAYLLKGIPKAVEPLLPGGDVSFIGSMYTEKHSFYERLTGISDYTRGYLEGIMAAQQKIQGYNFIQELLSPEIIQDMKSFLPMAPNPDGVETMEYLYAQYVINRKITSLERNRLLTLIGSRYRTDVYTPDQNLKLPGITPHAPVNHFDIAPYIINQSKINLNISLRSIKSGIPQRAFDILGAGGFLLTNFQADFLEHFVPGEDFDYFDSEQDLLHKIDYYLSQEEERNAIAAHGHASVAAQHTYAHRIREWEAFL